MINDQIIFEDVYMYVVYYLVPPVLRIQTSSVWNTSPTTFLYAHVGKDSGYN